MASFSARGVTLNPGVINRARTRRQRRLVRRLLIAAAAAAMLAWSLHPVETGRSGSRTDRVAPSVLLSQTPFMGITCAAPNCDRIGLSVWLRRPARAVRAEVAGHRVVLSTRLAQPFQPAAARSRTMFVGYLQAPSLFANLSFTPPPVSLWAPSTAALWPAPRVALRVEDPGGGITTTALTVQLQMGWG